MDTNQLQAIPMAQGVRFHPSSPRNSGVIGRSVGRGVKVGALAGVVWTPIAAGLWFLIGLTRAGLDKMTEDAIALVAALYFVPVGLIYGCFLGLVIGAAVGLMFRVAGRTAAIATAPLLPVMLMTITSPGWILVFDTSGDSDWTGSALILVTALGPVLAAFLLIGRHVRALEQVASA